MLHMVVNVHNAESCLYRPEGDAGVMAAAFKSLGQTAEGKGASIHGSWVNTGSHTVFVLIDAPNAHVIDEIIRDAGLTGLTHSQVYSLAPLAP